MDLDRGISSVKQCKIVPKPVADPGFPRGGGANPKGGRQPIIWSIFPENCMKMKKFWARGGGARPSRPPLDPPLQAYFVKERQLE